MKRTGTRIDSAARRARLPIGVFDSGIGGLTVFRELRRALPDEDLIYLGDTARVPYGTKSPAVIRRYSLEIARFLLRQRAKMIVVACNSASANALDFLARRMPVPVIGVVQPGTLDALASSRARTIAVIGTMSTIRSGSYARMLRAHAAAPITVIQKACPLFVPLVEEGWLNTPITRAVAATYLRGLRKKNIDALILGCTHYPLLAGVIRSVLGKRVRIIDSARATARAVARALDAAGLRAPSNRKGREQFRCYRSFFRRAPAGAVPGKMRAYTRA